jgi:hypothetical protein
MSQMQKIAAYHTTIRKVGETTIVRLYNTDVVKFNLHSIELRTGGFRTVTTKARMNQTSNQYGLGYRVYQEKGEWKVLYKGVVHRFENRDNGADYRWTEGEVCILTVSLEH